MRCDSGRPTPPPNRLATHRKKYSSGDVCERCQQISYTEKYSSGDVCERCLWQDKRAKRSGSGQNLASHKASSKFWAPQQDRRGDAEIGHFRTCAFIKNSYQLRRSTQVVEEA